MPASTIGREMVRYGAQRRRRHWLLVCAMVFGAFGCSREQVRIEQALEQAFANALVGCVPVAWERTREPTTSRMGTCGTGRWQNNIPVILDALSHTARVRVVAESQGQRLGVSGNQYELVGGFPIVTLESTYSTTTAICWGDVRVQVVDIDQNRLWKWDSFYDVAAAAGIDTLRIAQLRKRHLSVDVWYQMAVVPRPWATRLEPRHLATLRRHSFRAPHTESVPYLIGKTWEESIYVQKAIGTFRDNAWTFRKDAWGAQFGDMSHQRITRGRSAVK